MIKPPSTSNFETEARIIIENASLKDTEKTGDKTVEKQIKSMKKTIKSYEKAMDELNEEQALAWEKMLQEVDKELNAAVDPKNRELKEINLSIEKAAKKLRESGIKMPDIEVGIPSVPKQPGVS